MLEIDKDQRIKLLELQLAESNRTIERIHRLIKSGMWSMFYDENGVLVEVRWSDEFRRMLGYTSKLDFPDELESWSELIHPEDWIKSYDSIVNLAMDYTSNAIYKEDIRLFTKDRGYRWFRATGDFVRRPDGSPISFSGVVFDVTEEKKYDQMVKDKEKAYQDNLRLKNELDLELRSMEKLHVALRSGRWSMRFNEHDEIIEVEWSDEIRHLFGFSNEEDFPNELESWATRLHPDESRTVLQEFFEVIEDRTGQKTLDTVCRVMTKKAHFLWFHIIGNVVRRNDGSPIKFIGTCVDVTKDIEYNDEMTKNMSVISALSEDYEAVYYLDVLEDKTSIYRSNEHFIDLENLAMENKVSFWVLLHSFVDMNVHVQDQKNLKHILNRSILQQMLKEKKSLTFDYRDISGPTERFNQIKLVKLNNGMRLEKLVIGFADIDDQKRKNITIMHELEDAQHASEAKTAFLNNVSHDVRTPMNAIIGFAHLALDNIGKCDAVKGYIEKILTSSNHLLSLINDVLDMSRIESGKISLNEENLNLLDDMEELMTIFQADIEAKRHHMTMDYGLVSNRYIVTDKLRFNQIMMNIISNAIKYTPMAGDISVTVTEEECAEKDMASYEFRIRDNGIGMSLAFQEKLFQPFERERNTTVSGIQGTGLGMSITKNIVDKMGGTISVSSQQNIGSEFILRFKFQKGVADDSGKIEPELDRSRMKGKRVLLVEDHELNREIAVNILEAMEIEVETAANGALAVDMVENTDPPFDLVLMDIQMPVMDGYEAANKIRMLSNELCRNVPIVAMTANAFEEDRKKAMDCGMNAHLAKPIVIRELEKVLWQFLSN